MSKILNDRDLLSEPVEVPQFLVSVRSVEEARVARDAAVDLIDLKEPSRGPLGMVDLELARQIASECPESHLSLALGELGEWISRAEFPVIPREFQFLKLGLADQRVHTDWRQNWCQIRMRLEESSLYSFRWIAVVYADWREANAPAPEEIIQAAIEQRCAGVLFDTYSKEAGNLLSNFSTEQLATYRETIHSAGLLTAWAGSLRLEHLSHLVPLQPDVIAVRGAVCDDLNRDSELQQDLITDFRSQLLKHAGQDV